MASDHDPPAREFNKVMLFWRELIGEETFHTYPTAELWRWYQALERMGPLDVRMRVIERSSAWGLKELNGIVGYAPHPPMVLVEKWLETHELRRSPAIPIGIAAGLFTFIAVAFSQFSGCTLVAPPNQLQMHPPLPRIGTDSLAPQFPSTVLANPASAGSFNIKTGGFTTPSNLPLQHAPLSTAAPPTQPGGSAAPVGPPTGLQAQPLSQGAGGH